MIIIAKFKYGIFIPIAAILFNACLPSTPAKTPLEIRQMQTRLYNGVNIKLAMKAMIALLQDEGYSVRESNLDLGTLRAVKEKYLAYNEVKPTEENPNPTFDTQRKTECSVNIDGEQKTMKVRMVFNHTWFNNKGGMSGAKKILDAEFYQNMFSKFNKAMFLEAQGL